MKQQDLFHLGLKYSDLKGATIAIIPGDPKRVKKIAKFMLKPCFLSINREFTIWRSELEGNSIIICSTGIGGPSTSIVIEELSQLGIRTFLRIGTTGAIQDFIKVGDIIITTASVRLDGSSQHFAPISFPAVANFECTTALIKAAKKNKVNLHIGVTVSSDTFYPGQERYNTYSGRVIKNLKGSMKEWQKMGAMNYEMESATLLTMCATQRLRAGMISGVIVNRLDKEIPKTSIFQDIENITISIVVEAARILLTN